MTYPTAEARLADIQEAERQVASLESSLRQSGQLIVDPDTGAPASTELRSLIGQVLEARAATVVATPVSPPEPIPISSPPPTPVSSTQIATPKQSYATTEEKLIDIRKLEAQKAELDEDVDTAELSAINRQIVAVEAIKTPTEQAEAVRLAEITSRTKAIEAAEATEVAKRFATKEELLQTPRPPYSTPTFTVPVGITRIQSPGTYYDFAGSTKFIEGGYWTWAQTPLDIAQQKASETGIPYTVGAVSASTIIADKPDISDIVKREQEFRDAIKLDEDIKAGIVEFPEDISRAEYQESLESIEQKLVAIEQAKQVVSGELVIPVQEGETPEQAKIRYEQSLRAITSPFTTISPEGISIDISSAIKAGKSDEELLDMGIKPEILVSTKRRDEIIAELKKYPDLPTAIREGKIELLREAADLGLIQPQQGDVPDRIWKTLSQDEKVKATLVDVQIITAEVPRSQLLTLVPPLVITVEDGKESLNPIVAGKVAAEGKLNLQTLRQLGYDISEEELTKWAKVSTALDQVKIKVTEVMDSGFGKYPVTTTGYNYIDAIQKGLLSADDLSTLGFKPEDISTMVKTAELETKLEPYRKTTTDWMSSTFEKKAFTDIGQALVDKAVTKEELLDLGYDKEGLDKAEVYSKQGLKVWIPVYGTIATWRVSSPLERGMSVVGDVLLIVPTAGWLGKAGSTAMKLSEKALAVGIAKEVGALGRVGAAAKAGLYATEQLAVAPITFPIQVITSPKVALKGLWEITAFPFAHPLETAKGIGAITTGKAFLGEPMTLRAARYFTTAAIPESAIAIPTKGTGVQRVFTDTLISRGIPPKEADRLALEATQAMQIKLSDMNVRGEPIPKTVEVPVYENGELKFTIKFGQSLVMRELGQVITATPFAERIFTGAAEPMPYKIYFSTAMSPEWTGVSARGYTTPEAIELGRGGAIVKDMRINRLFDPVSKTYRNSVELEMTTAKGTQLVTGRDPILDVLKAEGNVKVFPSKLMPETKAESIIDAIRASEGKEFVYKPVNFDEVKSLPKGSGRVVEEFVRANNIMVGGSTAERTWTDTIHLPEDIDLISLKNNAKIDAERFAKLLEGFGEQMRIKTPEEIGKEVYRIERWNPKTKWLETVETVDPKTGAKASSVHERIGKWEQVTDLLDYRVHRTYNPDILNREPILDNGIKIEHPLEQAERITAKYTEYQEGVPIEQHRGHPKRLAWMAEKILDTPGGKLTLEQTNILEVVGTRIDYPEVPISKIIRMKIGGLRDAVIDEISKVIPALRRGVRVVTPDGRTIEVPRTAADELQSFIKNNPKATTEEINEVVNRGIERIVNESVARKVSEGKFRAEIEKAAETDPILRGLSKDKLSRYIDEIESQEIYKLHRSGRFTIDEVKGMVYSGIIGSGVARAIIELAREVNDRATYEKLSPILRELPKPAEELAMEYLAPREVAVTPLEERMLEEPYKLGELYVPEIPYVREEGILPREGFPPEEPYIPELRILEPPFEVPPYRPPEEPPYEPPYRPPEYPPEKPPYKPSPPIRVPKGDKEYAEQVAKIQTGTVVFLQGRPQGSGGRENVGMYKILPPPYRQEDFFTMRETPPGYKDMGWSGKGMAKKSLQVIGGLPASNIENIDLGWARININVAGGKPEIEYVHDVEANVGERSQTVGMGKGQIPLEQWEEAKSQGVAYDEFVASYGGELVGQTAQVAEGQEAKGQEAIKESIATAPATESTEVISEPTLEITPEETISEPIAETDEPLPLSEDEVKQAEIIASPPLGTIVWQDDEGLYQVAVPPYGESGRFSTSQQISGYGEDGISREGFGTLAMLGEQEGISEVSGGGYKTVKVLGGVLPNRNDVVDLGIATVRMARNDILVMRKDPEQYEKGHWVKRPKQVVETKDGARYVYRENVITPAGISKARKELTRTVFASSGGNRKVDRMLDTFAGVERQRTEQESSPIEDETAEESEYAGAFWGKPILDVEESESGQEELPATVVQSYIRRKKPRGNQKDWWESSYYEPSPPPKPLEKAISGMRYYGRELLPPELGVEL